MDAQVLSLSKCLLFLHGVREKHRSGTNKACTGPGRKGGADMDWGAHIANDSRNSFTLPSEIAASITSRLLCFVPVR